MLDMLDLANSSTNDIVTFGPFRLFAAERILKKNDVPLPIDGRAFDLLIALVERPGEILTHKQLMAQVWTGVTVEEANLRVHIAAIRKVLGDGRNGARYITNVAGRGYCFVAPTRRQLKQSTTASSRPVKTRTLPPKLRRMIGRDENIDALRSMIVTKRFVSIVGPGGMGKTTLVVAVAHAMMNEFNETICFVPFVSQGRCTCYSSCRECSRISCSDTGLTRKAADVPYRTANTSYS
jgi:DNA-binding winged helix-turn-helix (wHTH) protein